MKQEVMIVTGEASGDLHGARLVRSMRKLAPHLEFCGMGGPELERNGVEILYDAAKISVVGFFEVISHLADIISAQKVLRQRLASSPVKLLILIDLPDFNLMLARKAKKLGIPVFYYISPQVWAWRASRVKTIRNRVDRLGVILPFEEDYFRKQGVEATYVGHPLLDSVKSTVAREEFRRSIGSDQAGKVIGILPGSRKKEVARLLPVFLEAAFLLQSQCPEKLSFLVPCATTISPQYLHSNGIDDYRTKLDVKIVSENRYDLMAACDGVIAASGTVTLELLLLNTPMVVAYRLSPHTYQLGRLLVKIDYFALVNLIAGYEMVPELLQDEANPERISGELYRLLYDDKTRQTMQEGFALVRDKLGKPGASERAASLAMTLLK